MKRNFPNYKHVNLGEILKIFPCSVQKDINSFLDYCRINASENSIRKIFAKIVLICDVVGTSEISFEDLKKFLVLLNQSNRATDTSNDIKKVLKRFLKWKFPDWNTRFNGFSEIKQKRKTSNEKLSKDELLTPQEIEDLIRFSPKLMYKALIILMFESAGRPEEIFKLKWKDINFENKEVHLCSSKTGNARVIPVNQSINRLSLYKQEYPYQPVKSTDFIFPSPINRLKHISEQSISDYFKRLGKKINKHVFPYLFRHTRLNSIRKLLSPDVYQKYAGHSMEVALEHYSHIDNDDVRDEMFNRIYNIEPLSANEREDLLELKKNFLLISEKLKFIEKKLHL